MAKRRVPVNRRNEPVVESRGTKTGDRELPAREEPEPEITPCDCVELDPDDWHEVESDWSDITFLPFSVGAVMGVPLGYKGLLRRVGEKTRNSGLTLPEGAMVLVGPGRFRRPVWVEVEEGEGSSGGRTIRPGGVAYTRLVPAAYGDLRKRFEETEAEAKARYGRKPDSMWTWFLTCRQCSEERDFETLFVAHYAAQS